MHTIAIAGHICVDITPTFAEPPRVDPGHLFEIGPARLALGGCVANTAATLTSLGSPVTIHATVGDDELGAFVQRSVDEDPLMHGALLVDPAVSTSYSVVLEAPGRDRTFWHHAGANTVFEGSRLDLTTDVLHVGYPALLTAMLHDNATPLAELLSRAKQSGVTTSVDLSVVDDDSDAGGRDWELILRRILPFTDIFSPSVDDLTSSLGLTAPLSLAAIEDLAAQLVGWGAAVVAVSAGRDGVIVRTATQERLNAGGRALQESAPVWSNVALRSTPTVVEHPVTTNGAGDASTGGLLFAIAAGGSPDQALALAAACSLAVVLGRRPDPRAIARQDASLDPLLTAQDSGWAPIRLAANQPPHRFYRGGEGIARLRGESEHVPNTPEDWVGSTTCVRGSDNLGKSVLPDGRLLADAIEEDPVSWLGLAHTAAYGTDTRLLVKLLDAGQRLPIHAHPDGAFAKRWLGTAHGKAEAWHILAPGEVYLGLTEDVTPSELARIVAAQETDLLLDRMHKTEVGVGDRVYVPPGLLHAIGEGVLLAEVQEPEDLSILLEWRGFDLDGSEDGHLGLSFDTALTAVEHTARTADQIAALVRRRDDPHTGLPVAADEYFRLHRISIDGEGVLGDGFAVVIAIEGDLDLVGPSSSMSVSSGSTVLLPYAADARRLVGTGTVLVARPPVPRTY